MATEGMTRLQMGDSGDGDTWWIVGHVPDDQAIIAVKAEFLDEGELEGTAASDFCVTRAWWRDAHDPDDDEKWVRCEATDEGAEPFTLVEL